jgi:hypothetical protein
MSVWPGPLLPRAFTSPCIGPPPRQPNALAAAVSPHGTSRRNASRRLLPALPDAASFIYSCTRRLIEREPTPTPLFRTDPPRQCRLRPAARRAAAGGSADCVLESLSRGSTASVRQPARLQPAPPPRPGAAAVLLRYGKWLSTPHFDLVSLHLNLDW